MQFDAFAPALITLPSIRALCKPRASEQNKKRNLLPVDNFSQSTHYLPCFLTSANSSVGSADGSFASDRSEKNISGFKIMTVTRGYTEEADKILDYLEYGIFDALQKQYLRSFVFAIYLDNQDPNNIVEAYTFNFQYYRVPGSNAAIPVMTLGEDLMKLSISGSKTRDPVVDATKKGKIPTLGEVKRSVKALIKNLIQATTQMDTLPKRRFATFKLFYYDHTPDDYEPPHFRAGDAAKDKWFFTTHDRQEVPEKCSVGQIETGWHGVDVRVASVSAYLPTLEDNNAPFSGTTVQGNGLHAPPLTPAEEAETRLQQIELQKEDAQKRHVVWDAEEGLADADAEGENDDGRQVLGAWRIRQTGSMEFVGPLGMRDGDGNIVPLPCEPDDSAKELSPSAECLFQGVKEKVPRHVGQLELSSASAECTQTQCVDQTQIQGPLFIPDPPSSSPLSSPCPSPTPRPAPCRVATGAKRRPVLPPSFNSTLPPSDPIQSSCPSIPPTQVEEPCESIDTQMLTETVIARRTAALAEPDTDMLDMSTQVENGLALTESALIQKSPDAVLACECGVDVEDSDCLFCDGGCNHWFHVWCMGYHSGIASDLPEKFICFDCRVRADQNWDLIMVHNLHPRMMAKFRDLALFRRAIKICEQSNPENLAAFAKLIGCESLVASQLFKRLETEGFIALENREQDDLGMMETTTYSSKSKNKKGTRSRPTRRKTTHKPRYVFVRTIINTQEYQDYFNPSPDVEKRILGLAELASSFTPARRSNRKRGNQIKRQGRTVNAKESVEEVPATPDAEMEISAPAAAGSQTQAETQLNLETQDEEMDLEPELKRKTSTASDDSQRNAKKVKISIGPAVDLGD
ncbi:hypothetical protein NM688_g1079 [Phlebia brevispora]|uniref:Uncharacterized protein n=1 Tax=Phlebia brevispora TaxID=194682 RepID=A0ACC1TC72_9APHY|nr:hypothetical protein NM688_g1079 [Phlebia brevispora]